MDRWPDDGQDGDGAAPGPPDDWPPEAWDAVEPDPVGGDADAPALDGAGDPLDFEELYDTDELAAIEAGVTTSRGEPVTRVSQWRRRSALGAVLTGLALGLKEVFEPDDERSIVIEVGDDGMPTDLPVHLFLDPDSPAGSLCIVRRSDVKPPVV